MSGVEIHPIRSLPKEEPGALNKFSRTFTQNAENGGAKAMLWATGVFKDDTDMAKPQIGISSVWWEGNPCNQHLLGLAQKVKEGCELEGLIGFMHSTVGVSDGMTQGNLGMKYSLPSRDLIADSIELIVTAQAYDGNISIPGCDKNMPGVLMAAVRHNKPTLIVYGGTIQPGARHVDCPSLGAKAGDPLTIGDAFESYGAFLKGTIGQEERDDVIRHACPGVGACGGQFTANSMSSCLEVLGMSLPYSASTPAVWPEKQQECLRAAKYMRNLLVNDIKPSDILTKKSFENAIVVMNLTGGSTNSVLHLLAMARCARIDLTVDDFQRIANKTPYIADLKPSGKYVMEDLHKVGGIPSLLKYIIRETDLIDGSQLTVTGLTLTENVAEAPDLDFAAQDVIRPLNNPIKATGHLTILKGNLAPNSAVAKITGKEGTQFDGVAMVFDDEESFYPALQSGKIKPGTAVILRYQGPKGAPGMPEMLGPTGAMIGANLANTCCLITDGRFSGASRGFIVGHVTPEAYMGGPIALVQDGDRIIVDSISRNIEVVISDEEMIRRRAVWVKPQEKFERGVLFRYARDVQGAEYGAYTD